MSSLLDFWKEVEKIPDKRGRRKRKEKRSKKIIFGYPAAEKNCIMCGISSKEEPLEVFLREDSKIFCLCRACKEKVLRRVGVIPLNLPEILGKRLDEPKILRVEEAKTRRKLRIKVKID